MSEHNADTSSADEGLPQDVNALYREALYELAEAAPRDDWQSLWLLVEMHPDGSGGTIAAFAIAEAEPNLAHYFGMDFQRFHTWRRIWQHFVESGQEPWTSATVTLNRDGQFAVNLDYEPLGDELATVRRKRWLEAHLPDVEVVY